MNMIVRDGILGPYNKLKRIAYRTPTTVADVMTKAVITLSTTDSFAEAVKLMTTRDFRHLVVTDDKQTLLGVISDRDILGAMGSLSDWRVKQVRQVMTPDPITATPETLLSIAVSTMLAKKINCLPVVDYNGAVCGIVTSTDIMKSYQNILESTEAQAR
jgi:CBS domain-containing protein